MKSILLDVVYHEPNNLTKATIKEAMSGHNHNKIYSNVDKMFNDILSEE